MSVRFLISSAALITLTACGGGGGGGVDLDAGPGSFGDLVAETDRLTRLVLENPDYDPVAPSVGGSSIVNFDGIVGMTEPGDVFADGVGWLGQVDVTANFSSGTLNGTANNFFENRISGGEPTDPAFSRSGSVTLTAGIANPDFTVTLGGSLDLDGIGGAGAVSGDLDGNFFGPNSSTIDAFAARGTATADGVLLDWTIVADD